MPRWWNGRHAGLRSRCPKGRESSSLSLGTKWTGSSEAEQNPVKVEVEIS